MSYIFNVRYFVREEHIKMYFFPKQKILSQPHTWKINQKVVFYYLYITFESEVEQRPDTLLSFCIILISVSCYYVIFSKYK